MAMIYYAAVGVGISWAVRRRGLSLLVVAPPIWVAYEFIRSVVPVIKFPWLLAGHTQVGWLPMIQVLDLGGVYLLSFVVVVANAYVAQAVLEWGQPARRRRLAALGSIPAGLILVSLLYGVVRIRTIQVEPGPRVCLVQGNIPQEIKLTGQAGAMLREYLRLSEEGIREGPSLLVWPETMYPVPLLEEEWRGYSPRR
jgi:apolipoprotein N-acyltransferase